MPITSIMAPLLHAPADPAGMQPYLAKCFAGLHQLHITEEAGHSPEIVAMVSLQGERVPFVKPLRVSNELYAASCNNLNSSK